MNLNTQTAIGALVILIVLFIIYFYAIVGINRLNEMAIRHQNFETQNDSLQFVFERNGIVDCTATHLPCVTDRQCRENCTRQNAVGELVCNSSGFCSNADARISGRPDDFKCDASLGLVTVFVASEFVVDHMCISTYRDLIDDEGQLRPYLCDKGQVELELTHRSFSADDCQCLPNYTKMLFDQTALARTIPVCIPNDRANIYKFIYNAIA
ncbi:pif3 [Lambdina fiscellaria nucleopolyhedrovirus]|uniref:Pif3 n=1 Tax=Lambdina fiscellaria nucleopolyhedrovirus TaxID=1642929 RepID=A0A0E3URQ1_9ABAC|nr:pif3 [Lambdina fiscellaria nucleopolyhedrovirus]AKC91664.1 pif3 [Lambdina fiscellaria nucleopolyhedrovirus]